MFKVADEETFSLELLFKEIESGCGNGEMFMTKIVFKK